MAEGNIQEVSPPGWGGSVLAMKKHHPEIKNPWSLAWSMQKKKFKPHYKNDPEGTKSKKEPEKKPEFKNEDKPKEKKKMYKFGEWFEQRELNESKKKKKKGGLKYALNIEGEPTEIEEGLNPEAARVAHSAITKMGYGIGRPRIQGDSLVYNTADPEDAEMIAGDIPQQLARWGIDGKAVAQGINIVVTIS